MNARRAIALLALFSLLAVVHTWPLASAPGTLSRNDNADTVLNEWAIAWVAHQLPRDPLRLFDANIFYPERRTLAFSEHLIVQGLMGLPLFAAGASAVLAYNLLVLAGFALTGWGMCLVVHRWTGDTVAAVAAGSLAAFNAHSFTRIPHLQALHVEFLPLAIFALDRLLVAREFRWAAALGLAFSLQSLTSNYWMVFATLAVVAAFLVRPGDWWGRRFPLAQLAVAALIVACLVAPFLLPYYHVSRELGVVRSLDDVAWYSGSWRDYLSTPGRIHFNLWSRAAWESGGRTPLFPGVLALSLAAFAVVGLVRSDRRVRMWAAIAIVAFLFSFGTSIPGYAILYKVFPLLKGIRAPVRAGHMALIAVAALAGFGLAHARRRWPLLRRAAVTAVLMCAVAAEAFVAPIPFVPAEQPPAIYATLAAYPRAIAVELPLSPPSAPQHNASFMLASTRHWRPMLNGYSGFVPGSYVRHWEHLRDFPSPGALAYLKDQRVTHIVVHGMDPRSLEHPGLEPVAADGAIAIYRLRWERIEDPMRR